MTFPSIYFFLTCSRAADIFKNERRKKKQALIRLFRFHTLLREVGHGGQTGAHHAFEG